MKRLPHPNFIAFLAVLLGATGAFTAMVEPPLAMMLGFDMAAAAFIALTMRLTPSSPADIRAHAARNDAGRGLLLLLAILVAVVVMLAVGQEAAKHATISATTLAAAIATLVLAWVFSNVVYALHYAHMYYDARLGADREGLLFPQTQAPDYWDFCYFAFVIGATFQVSDVQVTAPEIRRVVLLHSLSAFFFNVGALALTVNVVGGWL
jgi:uncharacterized membrane protein